MNHLINQNQFLLFGTAYSCFGMESFISTKRELKSERCFAIKDVSNNLGDTVATTLATMRFAKQFLLIVDIGCSFFASIKEERFAPILIINLLFNVQGPPMQHSKMTFTRS